MELSLIELFENMCAIRRIDGSPFCTLLNGRHVGSLYYKIGVQNLPELKAKPNSTGEE